MSVNDSSSFELLIEVGKKCGIFYLNYTILNIAKKLKIFKSNKILKKNLEVFLQLQLKISLDQITFGLRWIFLFVWLVLLSLFWFCFCFFKDSERFVLTPTIILASKLSIFSKNTEHFPYHIYVLIQTS